MKSDFEVSGMAVKFVDDPLFSGQTNIDESIVRSIESRYDFDTVILWSRQFLFSGPNS